MDCDLASDKRCRLYEALPSVLLTMNRLPSYGERMAAARNMHGGWARLETARGDWKADSATRPDPIYDWNRSGVRAGIDLALGESGRFGISMHGLDGAAELAWQGGKIAFSGMGVGMSATAMAGGVYLDAQAQATWFDVRITSGTGRLLKDKAKGEGYALALEAGRPIEIGGGAVGEAMTVTPRAGVAWQEVTLDTFIDSRSTEARVSLEDASSLMGSLGLGVATRMAGGLALGASMDARQEFSEETEARFGGARLKASSKAPSVRFGLNAAHSWGEDHYSLQASAAYTAGGVDNNALAGGVSIAIRF